VETASIEQAIAETDFQGVVLVRGDGGYERAAGLASRRWNVPNALDTRFDTASITKLFTAVAVLQQVEAGDLDLELPVHHYIDLEGSAIPVGVTLLQLLTHTSGIADDADEAAGESYDALYASVPAYTLVNTADYLPLFAHKAPLADPGTATEYSNAGYLLAGLALERVTGTSYRDYVQRNVFERAGMADSGFFDRRDAVPRVAEGGDVMDGRWVANTFRYPPVGSPSDGAYATAGDLLRFLDAVREGKLLKQEFTEEFLLPQVDADEDSAYGFGLEFDMDETDEVHSYYAAGVNAGASGILRSYPEAGVDVVVLSNTEDGAWPIVQEIDALF
jgi:CubicO group peptidase (beta-lactamase class C family)